MTEQDTSAIASALLRAIEDRYWPAPKGEQLKWLNSEKQVGIEVERNRPINVRKAVDGLVNGLAVIRDDPDSFRFDGTDWMFVPRPYGNPGEPWHLLAEVGLVSQTQLDRALAAATAARSDHARV